MSIASYHQEQIGHTVWLHIAWTCAWTGINSKVPWLELAWTGILELPYRCEAKKTNKTRSFIARNVHSCLKKAKAACYTTLVRPAMEYATTAGVPHTAQNCKKTGTGPATCCSVCMSQVGKNSQRDSYVERLEVGDIGDQA